jgi:hypothetical protein
MPQQAAICADELRAARGRQQAGAFGSAEPLCRDFLQQQKLPRATLDIHVLTMLPPVMSSAQKIPLDRVRYRRMGTREFTAADPEHYTEIALRLSTDSEYRAQARGKILERSHLLYDDLGAVREFERCFEQMCSDD